MPLRTESPGVLDAILALSEAISGKEPLEEGYPKILNAIQDALGANRIAVLLLDSEGKMRFRASNGLSAEYRNAVEGHLPWPLDVQNPEPIVVSNCLIEPSISEFHDLFRAEGIGALAFLPLCCRGALAGKFMIYYNAPHAFAPDEISLGKTLARLVGFAVERSRNDEAVQKRLQEKQVLLRELHHRVKNNLQIISSVLNLQSLHADRETRILFQQSQKRLQAMSLIHEMLLQLEELDQVDLGRYIRDLSTAIVASYQEDPGKLNLNVDALPGVLVDANNAVSFGLIVNEILSNAVKHAFVGKGEGTLDVLLQRVADGFELTLKDDGSGFPEPFDWQNHTTLGLRIVTILVEQLQGRIHIDPPPGTTFRIHFRETPVFHLRAAASGTQPLQQTSR